MKKKITISIILLIVLIFQTSFVKAMDITDELMAGPKRDFEITEEKMIEALNEICGFEKEVEIKDGEDTFVNNISYKNISYTFNKENKEIELNTEVGETKVKYNIKDENPKFSYKLNFNKMLEQEALEKKFAEEVLVEDILFVTIAKVCGTKIEDASTYTFNNSVLTMLKELLSIEKEGYSQEKNIEYGKNMLKALKENQPKQYYIMNYNTLKETEDTWETEVTLEFISNADYSKLDGLAEGKNGLNVIKKVEEALTEVVGEEELKENFTKAIESIGKSIEVEIKNEVKTENQIINANKIPKTGHEFNLVDLLKITIATCVLIGISIFIYQRKNNINK